jgi:hypothetical protein
VLAGHLGEGVGSELACYSRIIISRFQSLLDEPGDRLTERDEVRMEVMLAEKERYNDQVRLGSSKEAVLDIWKLYGIWNIPILAFAEHSVKLEDLLIYHSSVIAFCLPF